MMAEPPPVEFPPEEFPLEEFPPEEAPPEEVPPVELPPEELPPDNIDFPEIPVDKDNTPQGWAVEDTEGSGGLHTRHAIESFKADMRQRGLLVGEPDPNLEFRYNTKTKEFGVLFRGKFYRLNQRADTSKFCAPATTKLSKELRAWLEFREQTSTRISAAQTQALSETRVKIPDVQDLTDDALDSAAGETDTAVKSLFTNVGTNTDGLPMRELEGLDKAIQRSRGALTDNIAKLKELDADIAQEERKLNERGIDEATRERVAERLQRLRDERTTRLEAASQNREALRSQISRVRETIERVLNDDTTLAERIRTLFREQGITIASMLTALGFIVSTIVLAVTGGGGSFPTPGPSPSLEGAKEWVKKQLRKLGDWMKYLAGKAAASLPGIIGAIVSWLLKTAGGVAVWLAEHLWALAVGLIVAVVAWITEHERGRVA